MSTGKRYDNEYKVQAVKLAMEIGQTKAAHELGISKSAITQTSHTENIPYALINQLELNVESHSRTLLCTQTTHPKSGQIVQESFQERFDQQDF